MATLLPCISSAQAEDGRTLHALYTGDWLSNVDGGIKEDHRYLFNADLWTRVGVGSANDSVYVHGSYNNGKRFSPTVVGDTQIVSNIEADEATRLYQLYYERGSEEDRAGFLFGLWDLNSRIDVIEPALLFVNSAHGIGTDFGVSGERGPSIFPVTSLGLYGHYRVKDGLTLRGAVLDGVPGDPDKPHRTAIRLSKDDGALLVSEATWAPASDWVARAGAWHYTADFEPLDGGDRDEKSSGAYVSVAGELRPDTLSTWLRYGVASDEVNRVGQYLGTGLVWQVPGRLDDRAGIAVASAFAGDPLRDAGASRAETSVEMTYSVQVTPWLRLQPDIQYIFNPGLDRGLDDAWVIGLRLELKNQVEW